MHDSTRAETLDTPRAVQSDTPRAGKKDSTKAKLFDRLGRALAPSSKHRLEKINLKREDDGSVSAESSGVEWNATKPLPSRVRAANRRRNRAARKSRKANRR